MGNKEEGRAAEAGNPKNGTVGSTGNLYITLPCKQVYDSTFTLTTIEYYQYFTFVKLIKWDFNLHFFVSSKKKSEYLFEVY